MTLRYITWVMKYYLGHEILLGFNITREDLKDGIKTISRKLEVLMNLKQYFSNNAAGALPTLSNCCTKFLWKQAKYQLILNEPLLH